MTKLHSAKLTIRWLEHGLSWTSRCVYFLLRKTGDFPANRHVIVSIYSVKLGSHPLGLKCLRMVKRNPAIEPPVNSIVNGGRSYRPEAVASRISEASTHHWSRSLSTWAIDLVVCTSYYYSNFLWRNVSPYHLLWRKNPVQTRAQMEMKTRLQKLQVGVSAYGGILKEFKIPSDPQQKWFEFEIAKQQISQSLEFGDRSPDFSKKSDGFFSPERQTSRNLGNRWMVFQDSSCINFCFFASGAAPSGSKLDMFQMILVQISSYKLTTGGFLKSVSKNHQKPQGPNGNEFLALESCQLLGPPGGNSGRVDPEGSHIRR